MSDELLVAGRLVARPADLSQRQREAVRLRQAGLLHKQIAYALGISLSGVRNHLDRAQRKGVELPRIASWRGVRYTDGVTDEG